MILSQSSRWCKHVHRRLEFLRPEEVKKVNRKHRLIFCQKSHTRSQDRHHLIHGPSLKQKHATDSAKHGVLIDLPKLLRFGRHLLGDITTWWWTCRCEQKSIVGHEEQGPMGFHIVHAVSRIKDNIYIWENYNISLTWMNCGHLGMIPL